MYFTFFHKEGLSVTQYLHVYAFQVMVFLDSHCECNVGWLEPMLERIHRNRTTVVCPVIDVISWEKLEYSTVRGPPGVRGGFNWGLQFKWKKIPDYEQKRRGYDETREVKSPTMAGGLFAIDTKFFFEIGSYDTGMDIWGAENLEISFRVSFFLSLLREDTIIDFYEFSA